MYDHGMPWQRRDTSCCNDMAMPCRMVQGIPMPWELPRKLPRELPWFATARTMACAMAYHSTPWELPCHAMAPVQ